MAGLWHKENEKLNKVKSLSPKLKNKNKLSAVSSRQTRNSLPFFGTNAGNDRKMLLIREAFVLLLLYAHQIAMNNYEQFCSGGKKMAILIDPDKPTDEEVINLAAEADRCGVDFIFVGGSLLTNNGLSNCIRLIKSKTTIPVILFPGNTHQISHQADSFLFLSLISGRNPDMLIGAHVIAAPYLKISGLEIISTGYMLIESGRPTTVSYMSNSSPIPSDKNDIAMCTAMAGEMLGMKLIFMDAGSGALNPVPDSMIENVKASINIPLIIGGGIKTPEMAAAKLKAGADVVVIGNMLEKEPHLVEAFVKAVRSVN